jgi:hypothetical protein
MPPTTVTLPRNKRLAVVRRRAERPQTDEALDRETIAELSAQSIARMTERELHRLIRAARIPASAMRIEHLDRPTKERLAHQARLACRNRES